MTRRLLSILLIGAGAVVLFLTLLELGRRDAATRADLQQLRRLADQVGVTAVLDRTEAAASPTELPEPEAGALLGEVRVPRRGVHAPIREGIDRRTLARAAGHVPRTALPDERHGNLVLAAHRDRLFAGLRDVELGDEIEVTTPRATERFRVVETYITTPEHTAPLRPTAGRTLTLVTCYPFSYVGPAPKRLIVRATPVEPPTATADAAP